MAANQASSDASARSFFDIHNRQHISPILIRIVRVEFQLTPRACVTLYIEVSVCDNLDLR